MEPNDDPLPALQAEIDQTIAMALEVARMARGIYNAFKGESFTDAQALYLTAVQLKGSPGTSPS